MIFILSQFNSVKSILSTFFPAITSSKSTPSFLNLSKVVNTISIPFTLLRFPKKRNFILFEP